MIKSINLSDLSCVLSILLLQPYNKYRNIDMKSHVARNVSLPKNNPRTDSIGKRSRRP